MAILIASDKNHSRLGPSLGMRILSGIQKIRVSHMNFEVLLTNFVRLWLDKFILNPNREFICWDG